MSIIPFAIAECILLYSFQKQKNPSRLGWYKSKQPQVRQTTGCADWCVWKTLGCNGSARYGSCLHPCAVDSHLIAFYDASFRPVVRYNQPITGVHHQTGLYTSAQPASERAKIDDAHNLHIRTLAAVRTRSLQMRTILASS